MTPEAALRHVVARYEEACNSRNVTKFRELLALDDTRFSEIEDHMDVPFGSDTAESILKWIEDHPHSSYRVHDHNIQTYGVSDGVGYVTAQTTWSNGDGQGTGRVTFICVYRDPRWQILHGHWSNSPS